MKRIVVTGSTRGIGFGLADAFLARGAGVVVSGRTEASVERAVGELKTRHPSDRVLGKRCNVAQATEVEALWSAAEAHFGGVDIWINNAGQGCPMGPVEELDASLVESVVGTNVIGALHGCRVALRNMRQQGQGAVYNMEGLGSDGRHVEGLALYGLTKAALSYLDVALVAETRKGPVRFGTLSPGMVLTDLLTGGLQGDVAGRESFRRIFNILGDTTETVCPWLAERILEDEGHGTRINYLTRSRATFRFLAAPFRKREIMGAR
jgi:NAD(P)-dependent dehydrogenase (short-subunit alcohol dehydrogenase family)